MPLKETDVHKNSDLVPKIIDNVKKDGKVVEVEFKVPDNVEPDDIRVNVKDQCLIVKLDEKKPTNDTSSTVIDLESDA